MNYFSLNPLADFGAGDFCFTDETPDGIGLRWYRLAQGEPFGSDYPTDTATVTLRLGADYRGLKLPSFVGNAANMFIVDHATANAVLATRTGRIEVLPFVLLDHKGRVHSRDYVFLNPLERITCLNEPESLVRRSDKGVVKDVKNPVLDATKQASMLDFFRLGEHPWIYLLSDTLVSTLHRQGCTNLALSEIPLR